ATRRQKPDVDPIHKQAAKDLRGFDILDLPVEGNQDGFLRRIVEKLPGARTEEDSNLSCAVGCAKAARGNIPAIPQPPEAVETCSVRLGGKEFVDLLAS